MMNEWLIMSGLKWQNYLVKLKKYYYFIYLSFCVDLRRNETREEDS